MGSDAIERVSSEFRTRRHYISKCFKLMKWQYSQLATRLYHWHIDCAAHTVRQICSAIHIGWPNKATMRGASTIAPRSHHSHSQHMTRYTSNQPRPVAVVRQMICPRLQDLRRRHYCINLSVIVRHSSTTTGDGRDNPSDVIARMCSTEHRVNA